MRAFAAKRLVLSLLPALTAWPQTDPGVRGGPPGAGEPLRGLTRSELKFFSAGLDDFKEPQTVDGSQDGTGPGLGPRFNLDSCGGCHMHPAVGGSSPPRNPQAAFKTSGFNNPGLLPFVTEDGPVLEARFKSDGAVHALSSSAGAPMPPAATSSSRISRKLCGTITSVSAFRVRYSAPAWWKPFPNRPSWPIKPPIPAAKAALGISGRENRSSDGMLMRFGWKAQHHSLMAFSGEAYNVEQGVTNELSPHERDETPGCLFNATPEDHTNFDPEQPHGFLDRLQRLLDPDDALLEVSSDVAKFEHFMRFLAPPAPAAAGASAARGRALFLSDSLGCALCHTPSLRTGPSSSAALANQTVNLFSDLLLHRMGNTLADGITQGLAGPDSFRTAPLWGLGQRIFFLHDGRTKDLLEAIRQHAGTGSEAEASIAAFSRLTAAEQQDILNFLRSL